MRRSLTRNRFDREEPDPMGPLASLTDVMLVFICGLLVALAARSEDLREVLTGREVMERGEELAEPPAAMRGDGGAGMEPVGRVYRDPETGRLIMVGEDNG